MYLQKLPYQLSSTYDSSTCYAVLLLILQIGPAAYQFGSIDMTQERTFHFILERLCLDKVIRCRHCRNMNPLAYDVRCPVVYLFRPT